jgi:hypothetical protein
MLDKEAQEKMTQVHEAKEAMDEFVLSCMLDEGLPIEEIAKLRDAYIRFYREMHKAERKFKKSQRGTEADWLAMWKEQTND